MALTGPQKRALRALAHHLDPVVLVGAARVTDAVVAEVDRCLGHHELVKVKLIDASAEEVAVARDRLVAPTGAELVQTLGHTLVLFRRNPADPKVAALPASRPHPGRRPGPPAPARRARRPRRPAARAGASAAEGRARRATRGHRAPAGRSG